MAAQLQSMSQQQLGPPLPEKDTMDIDIDIDMDADVEPIPEPELEEGEEYETTPFQPVIPDSLVPAIYTEESGEEIQPTKVHIEGIDELSTDDVRNFAMEHWSTPPVYVQWIDDTSANLVYPSSDIAVEALAALCALPPTKAEILVNPLQPRETKARPGCHFQVRRAVSSDRKRRNAKVASRYYLLHPEADPIERMRAEFANGRKRRNSDHGDHGDYKRRSYNEREDRRRRDLDVNGEQGREFDASMYDDNPQPQEPRSRGRGQRGIRNRSASPRRSSTNYDEIVVDGDSASETEDRASSRRDRNGRRFRDRSSPPRRSLHDRLSKPNQEKELFPSNRDTKSGQLVSDGFKKETQSVKAVAAAKLKRELFPNRTDRSNHRRSHAFDGRAAADAVNSDDLSRRMTKRMDLADPRDSNGNAAKNKLGRELFPNSTGKVASGGGGGGLAIKGTGGLAIKGGAGMSIKGAAAANVRELFPDKYAKASGNGGGNEGRELFSDKIRGRGNLRRNKAEDLFGS